MVVGTEPTRKSGFVDLSCQGKIPPTVDELKLSGIDEVATLTDPVGCHVDYSLFPRFSR